MDAVKDLLLMLAENDLNRGRATLGQLHQDAQSSWNLTALDRHIKESAQKAIPEVKAWCDKMEELINAVKSDRK